MTVRSNDQFNTTVYGYHDRFRGVKGTRMVLFMNRSDIARLKLEEGDLVTLTTAVDDGVTRQVSGLRVTPYISLLSPAAVLAMTIAPAARSRATTVASSRGRRSRCLGSRPGAHPRRRGAWHSGRCPR